MLRAQFLAIGKHGELEPRSEFIHQLNILPDFLGVGEAVPWWWGIIVTFINRRLNQISDSVIATILENDDIHLLLHKTRR